MKQTDERKQEQLRTLKTIDRQHKLVMVRRDRRIINHVMSKVKLVDRLSKVMMSGDKRVVIRVRVRKMRFKGIINHEFPPTVSR